MLHNGRVATGGSDFDRDKVSYQRALLVYNQRAAWQPWPDHPGGWRIPGSEPGVWYFTNEQGCSCPGAQQPRRWAPVCKHRLAVQWLNTGGPPRN